MMLHSVFGGFVGGGGVSDGAFMVMCSVWCLQKQSISSDGRKAQLRSH